MAKQTSSSVLKTIIKWIVALLVFIGVPVFINIFSQPQYGVFDGMTIFARKHSTTAAVIIFIIALVMRVLAKKQKKELAEAVKGIAAFIIAGFAAYWLLAVSANVLRMHALATMYLIGAAMFLAFYFLEELPVIAGGIIDWIKAVSKKAGKVLKWVWIAFLVIAVPFLIYNANIFNFKYWDYVRTVIVFFGITAAWRFFVKKEKFNFLFSAGMFVLTGIAGILLKGLILRLPFINGILYNYFAALAAAFISMNDTAVLAFLQKITGILGDKLGPIFKKIGTGTAEFFGKFTKKSAGKLAEVKNKRIKALIAAGIILAAVGAFYLGKYIYDRAFVTVLAISPSGAVGENTLITAEFSKPVDLKVKDVGELKCFTITPALKGKYSFENKKTVIFTPDEPLLPSTDYEVSMSTAEFTAPAKRVIGSPKTSFHTEYIKITDSRFFVNRDILKNEEKEVVGEVNFNYPVSAGDLEKAVTVTKIINPNCNSFAKNESTMKFVIEKSESPKRFYIKIADIKRSYDCQQIKVKIAAGLKCAQCGKGVEGDFEQAVGISTKQYLAVESVSPWQEEGSTSVALRFNMPITEEQVKKYVTIIRNATVNRPAEQIPFTLKTEYCYAMFTGNFEPNLVYSVNVGQGIVSKNGDPMRPGGNGYSSGVRVQDLPSSLQYAEQGEILTSSGDMNVALRVMNLDRIYVQLHKVFKNNLVHYLRYQDAGNNGQQVFSGYHEITGGKINQEITEYVNFKKFSAEPYKGIFVLEIADAKNYWNRQSKIVRCTNIGLIAKTSGNDLIVKALSVNQLYPAADVTIKLMSTTNQVMQEEKTDNSGRVVFRNWRTGMYNFSPYLILAENGEDFSYLLFDRSMLDNYRFDTSGEPTNIYMDMKAFLTTDRGLYRPGETVNLTGIVRTSSMAIPPGVTIENRITGPQGEVVQSEKKAINSQGMETFSLKLPLSAMTGEYRSEIRLNNNASIGSVTFKVEEFIPDKLVVAVNPATPEMMPGSPLLFTVQANQMFGPPAAGNKLETEVKFIDYTFQSKKFKDYVFRDPIKSFSEKSDRLGGENLDALGKYNYEVAVPDGAKPPSAMLAEIYTEVYDDGGRPVGAYKTVPVHVYDYYLGLKLKDPRKIYKRGDKVELDIAAINPSDAPQNLKNVEVIVKRKVWYSIFRTTRWNRQQYDSSYYEEALVYKTININGQASLSFDADIEGEYYIYVGNEQSMRTGLTVNVSGPGFTTYDMSNAEKIVIAADKDKYKAGETAVINIKAPFDGMAYVTLDRNKVLLEKYIRVENGSARLEIPMLEEYMPNVYLNVVALRKPDEKLMSLPFSAFGVQNINIDKSAKDINPKISCKDEVMSTEGIAVTINNLPAGTAAVLAAVDEGILQIIRFETPDPLSFFYRKKAMETGTYSIFNLLLTDVAAKKAAIGGDADLGPMQRHLNPIVAKNVESYAKFSGIIYADDSGTINYKFDTKKFNGKVRVMAFTVKGDRFGSDDRKTNVVDPIVITPTLPRFLAPGDEFYLPVRVYNNTAKDSAFEIKVDIEGPVTFEKAVQSEEMMKSKSEKIFTFRGRAKDDAGKAVFSITASGADETMTVTRELAVRPAAHLQTKVYKGSIEPGKEFKFDLPANYIKQGKKTRVFMSYSRAAEYAGAFDYLIHYPYGCIEQTTSSGFPLIFFKDLGITKMLLEYQGINTETYINEIIQNLRKFILPGNRLTFWPGGNYEASDYTKLFVAHFVIEARLKGYYVPDDVYNPVIAAAGLEAGNQVSMQVNESESESENNYEGDGEGDGGEGGEGYEGEGDGYEGDSGYNEPPIQPTEPPSRLDRRGINAQAYNFENNIYKLYLKTLMNNPDANTMKYYEDLFTLYVKNNLKNTKVLKELGYSAEKIKNMSQSLEKEYMLKANLIQKTAADFANGLSETDRFMLSMSYSQYNNQEAAKMIVFDDFKSKYMIRELNGFFNSYARNLGMYLSALSLAEGKAGPRIEFNEDLLLKELKEDGSFGSTQETAWSLIGLANAAKIRGKGNDIKVNFYANGALYRNMSGAESVVLGDKENKWKNVKIESIGESKFYYNIYVEGTPKEKNKTGMSKGLKISRKYFDEEGREANLTSVTQGKLIVVSVTLEPQGGRQLDNVVVVDMLPAGFEIENPRIKTRGSLKFNPVSNFNAAYEDIRDDRMLMFTQAFSSPMTFSYTVRAVSPGKFVIPNAYAEAMYDPDVKAESYEGDYLVVVPNKF